MFAQAIPPNPARLQRAQALRRLAREAQTKRVAAIQNARKAAHAAAKEIVDEPVVVETARNKGGRPKGSKNRPKADV